MQRIVHVRPGRAYNPDVWALPHMPGPATPLRPARCSCRRIQYARGTVMYEYCLQIDCPEYGIVVQRSDLGDDDLYEAVMSAASEFVMFSKGKNHDE